MIRPAVALSTLLALTLLALAPAEARAEGTPPSAEGSQSLGRAWRFLEQGALEQARTELDRFLATDEGALSSEAHYGRAAVSWEQRNAREAWTWLVRARRGAAEQSAWNPGMGDLWQARIEERLRYIEARFTVRMLSPPPKGRPLPPLADPLPRDPILALFCAEIPVLVQAGNEANPGAAQWILLPNGSYWVGDRLEWHGGGQMETSEAPGWQLVEASGEALQHYERRLEVQRSGGSLARELIRKLMIGRNAPPQMVQAEIERQRAEERAAEYARRRNEMEALRARQRALIAAGKGDEAARLVLGYAGSGGRGLLTWSEVDADGLRAVSKELSEVWTEPGWHLRCAISLPDKGTRFLLELPELSVSVRIDRGGDVLIESTGRRRAKVKESLREVFTLGGGPNRLDIWFDGTRLKLAANGRAVGPVEVADARPGRTRWVLSTNDDALRLLDVRVEEFDGF